MRYRSLILVLLALVISCTSDANREKAALSGKDTEVSRDYQQDSLYQNVMLIHDNAMMLMSDVSSFNRKIKRVRNLRENFETKEEIQKVSQDLESANESMMDWMRNFDPDLETLSHEETMRYLESEKKKIEEIKKNMESAIKNAGDLLR